MDNNMNEYVSILIPLYNNRTFLKRCLDSISIQTYKNIVTIILDDCSTDTSIDIIKQYNVSYVHNIKNMGIGYSRNRLLNIAETKYCCWLDSDDYMHPNKIETQLTYIIKHNINFLATEMFDVKNNIIIGTGCNKAIDINTLTVDKLNNVNCINNPTVMFNSEKAKEIGGYNINCRREEDWEFYKRLYKSGYNVHCLDEPLYYYNIR